MTIDAVERDLNTLLATVETLRASFGAFINERGAAAHLDAKHISVSELIQQASYAVKITRPSAVETRKV